MQNTGSTPVKTPVAFNLSIECSKCGSLAATRDYLEGPDVLELVCDCCGYEWHMLPKSRRELGPTRIGDLKRFGLPNDRPTSPPICPTQPWAPKVQPKTDQHFFERPPSFPVIYYLAGSPDNPQLVMRSSNDINAASSPKNKSWP